MDEQIEIDFDATLESMGRQLSAAARDVAIKDGMIAALHKENGELRQQVDTMAERLAKLEPEE